MKQDLTVTTVCGDKYDAVSPQDYPDLLPRLVIFRKNLSTYVYPRSSLHTTGQRLPAIPYPHGSPVP
jgi:hypothetical protein